MWESRAFSCVSTPLQAIAELLGCWGTCTSQECALHVALLRQAFMTERKRKIDLGDKSEQKMSKFSDTQSANVNPYTGLPYSDRYHDLLRKRKTLPVYEFKDEFNKYVRENQVVVLVGETGSGKTTQVCGSTLLC